MQIGIGGQLLSYPRALYGGIGTYLRGILAALPAVAEERGHTLRIFVDRAALPVLAELGMNRPVVRHELTRFPLANSKVRLPWEQTVLPLNARRSRVDVFHFLDHVVSLAGVGSGSVVTIQDVAPILLPETYGSFRGRYKGMMTRLAARRANLIIASSEATKNDVVRLCGVPAAKVRVVYLGVDPIFHPPDDPKALVDVRERYRLPERFLLYVGRIEPRKNIDRILRGYAMARTRHGVRIPLVISGKPSWLYEDILRLPEQLGIGDAVQMRTDFFPQSDLPALYGLADALVFPTLYEGFGLPVLESLACGTPVITSNLSSLPEVAGAGGLLVNPLDVEAIADAIGQIVEDRGLRERLIASGIAHARGFTWEHTARETVAIYEMVGKSEG